MSDNKPSVLFVCSQRGARSRIAERLFNARAEGSAVAQCACFESGGFGPMIGKIMKEVGLPLPHVDVPLVYRHFNQQRQHDYVVFMCNDAMAEVCELFSNDVDKLFNDGEVILSWKITPFSALTGSDIEKLTGARRIRGHIQDLVDRLLTAIEEDMVAEAFDPIDPCELAGAGGSGKPTG